MTMRQDDFIDLNEVIPLLETKEPPVSSPPYESKSLTEAREVFEREFIIKTLNENNWKIAKAAEALNMDRANLYRKLRQLGINF